MRTKNLETLDSSLNFGEIDKTERNVKTMGIIYVLLGGVILMLGIIAYRLKPTHAAPVIETAVETKEEPKTVEWRDVKIGDEEPKYEVSELGEIRNKNDHYTLSTGKLSSGYSVVTLNHDGGHSQYSVAQIVANAFLGDGFGRVVHLDGDLTNNCVSNLAWERETVAPNFKYETWRNIYIDGDNTGYKVSSKGNFKEPNGVLIKGVTVESYNGERRIRIQLKSGKIKQIYASKLVASAFIENPNHYNFVEHLDGNVLNNEVTNLRWRYSRRGGNR